MPGNLNATDASAQVNQFLGTHAVTMSFAGTQVLTPTGGTALTWLAYGDTTDLDQPFILSGTSVGRVVLPVSPAGNGADMLVSLYPDNGSGAPNTAAALASTMVPAAYINQIAASAGLLNGGPLATEANNGGYCTGGVTSTPWAAPAADSGGASITASYIVDGDYFVGLGGNNSAGAAAVAGVASVQYLGGGQVALPIQQPALPLAVSQAAVAVCSGCLVSMGGGTGASGSTPSTAVYVASWDSNTGTVGNWSAQTVLPVATFAAAAAASGTFVYMLGGLTGAGPVVSAAVYMASLSNGQLGSWSLVSNLPVALANCMVAVVNGWMVVMGGLNSGLSGVSTVYFAPVNADGTLGAWQNGPSLPTANWAFGPGFTMAVADDLIVLLDAGGGSTTTSSILPVTVNGPGAWSQFKWASAGVFPVGCFGTGAGSYDVITLRPDQGRTEYSTLVSVPLVSVPLYATGLTNGNTYHVVMQQHQGATASDYLQWGLLNSTPLPSAALSSARHSGSWSTITAGSSVPMAVYDTAASGDLLHVSSDPNAYGVAQSWTSLLYNNPNLLIGELDVTLKPNNPLNSNPTFTAGVSPWTATGGTITQSAAQTHGGFAFSGLLTPNGTSAQAVALSEMFPVHQGGGPFYGTSQWVLLDGWFYSPPGTTAFSFSINWYDRAGTYLSTSSSTVTLVAATWTHVQNFFEVPATVAQGQLAPTESGTPASSKLIYISDAFAIKSWECVGAFTSAATVNYGTAPWPPTGVTQLL